MHEKYIDHKTYKFRINIQKCESVYIVIYVNVKLLIEIIEIALLYFEWFL